MPLLQNREKSGFTMGKRKKSENLERPVKKVERPIGGQIIFYPAVLYCDKP